MQKIAIILGAVLLAAALAGCASNNTTTTTPSTSTTTGSTPASSTPASTTPSTPAPTGPVMDVYYNATQTAPGPNVTYAFDGPGSVNPGWVTFHFTNKGQEPHQLVVVRLADGETFEQHMAKMMGGSNATMGNETMGGNSTMMGNETMMNDTFVGGIGNVLPGATANATVHLMAGTYVIECEIPGPAGPHFMHGMIKELNVTGTDNGAAEPTGDLTLSLFNYAFAWSTPPTAGHHVIKVVNNGTMDHEAPMERLVGNHTMQDFLAWAANPQGPPPVDQALGAGGISPGQVEYVPVDFEAGHTYGAACFFLDAQGQPHFVHGMVTQWTV